MAQIYISIGSNIEPHAHVPIALAELRQAFGPLRLSSVYESPAVGFTGDNFYNLVASAHTSITPQAVQHCLRDIEDRHGRVRGGQKFNSRTLDLDLLLYDDLCLEETGLSLPRDEILKYAFVLCPLAELAPQSRHPVTGQSYAELWAEFAQRGKEQVLWQVAFPLLKTYDNLENL